LRSITSGVLQKISVQNTSIELRGMDAGVVCHTSFVQIKKRTSSLSLLSLSSKWKRRLMELRCLNGNIYAVLVYEVRGKGGARLASRIQVDRTCEVGMSEEKSSEECLCFRFPSENCGDKGEEGIMESITFYPESDPVQESVAKSVARAGMMEARPSLAPSDSSVIGERSTDFESARNSIRLSMGAVSVLQKWETELKMAISKTKARAMGPADLQRLMRKKSLTAEEATMAKSLMHGEKAFNVGTSGLAMVPIEQQKEGAKEAPRIEELVKDCAVLEASISLEIAKEIETLPASTDSALLDLPISPPIDLPTSATATLGSKTLPSAAETAAMKQLMRQKSGNTLSMAEAEAEQNEVFSRLSIVEAQNRAIENAANPDVLELQALEASLDQQVLSTGITLPNVAIREKTESLKRGESGGIRPPPPPRRRSSAEFPFHAGDAWQVSMNEGEEVRVLTTHDDGWTKIRKEDGLEGFVPTDFLKCTHAPDNALGNA